MMSDMGRGRDPAAPEEPDLGQGLSWWRKGLLVVLALFGVTLLAGLVWFALFVTHYGDPAPEPGVVVDNQTAVSLNIYTVVVGLKPVLRAEIPPRARIATGISCGNLEMLAKHAGHLVARRGPLPACDESDWVISETRLIPSSSSAAGSPSGRPKLIFA
jgi:hypothetical protein